MTSSVSGSNWQLLCHPEGRWSVFRAKHLIPRVYEGGNSLERPSGRNHLITGIIFTSCCYLTITNQASSEDSEVPCWERSVADQICDWSPANGEDIMLG